MLRLLKPSSLLRPTAMVPHRGISFLSRQEIECDENPNERLEELGAFALKVALTKHLASTYPDTAGGALADLRSVNLSRHNLTRVADRLQSRGLIHMMLLDGIDTDKQGTKQYRNGFRAYKDHYAMGVAGVSNLDLHQLWEAAMMWRVEGRETVNNIHRVRMTELGKGFRAGMANYALEVAGIMYVDGKHNLESFWEKYKEYLEPIVSPQDFENRRTAAEQFDAEMKGVIEVEPRFRIVIMKST